MSDSGLLGTAQKWEPVIRRITISMLAVLLGVLISRLIWVLIEPGGAVSKTSTLPRYAAANANSVNIVAETSLLTTMNPFDIDANSSEIIVEEAPETALNLILLGSRASNVERFASATIRTPDNKTNVFKPGEEIISGVVLEQVLTDNQVLLRRNGVLESLRKEGSGEGFLTLAEPEAPPINAPVAQTGPLQVTDGQALFNSLSIQGVRDGNNLTGYRLSPRDDGALMRAAGLMPGDVLVAFDGDNISDIEPADVRDRLVNGSTISLTVKRQGTTETVTLSIGR